MHSQFASVPALLLRFLFAATLLCVVSLVASVMAAVAVADELQANPTPTVVAEPTAGWLHLYSAESVAPSPTPAQMDPPAPPPTEPQVTSTPVPTSTPTHPPPSPTRTRTPIATVTPTPGWRPPGSECYVKPGKPVLKLEVPYIHQVSDINNADGNWACGPTSVAMVLAYYGKLQPWPGTDAGGGSKGSGFAPYITEVYTNNDHTYSAIARDPQGKKVAGLYGTICPTGLADWSQIKHVLEWHGLSSKHIPLSFESVKAALKRGHPVLIGNDLTPAGHVLVAVGYTANNQVIVNDPYGNRFASGYGSTGGNALSYPWKCLRPHTALEVIGIYPPPVTPTPTAEPTATSTMTPTATDTPLATATPSATATLSPSLTPTPRSADSPLTISSVDGSVPPAPRVSPRTSVLYKVAQAIRASSRVPVANSLAAAVPSGRKEIAMGLMGLSLLSFLAGLYRLLVQYRENVPVEPYDPPSLQAIQQRQGKVRNPRQRPFGRTPLARA